MNRCSEGAGSSDPQSLWEENPKTLNLRRMPKRLLRLNRRLKFDTRKNALIDSNLPTAVGRSYHSFEKKASTDLDMMAGHAMMMSATSLPLQETILAKRPAAAADGSSGIGKPGVCSAELRELSKQVPDQLLVGQMLALGE